MDKIISFFWIELRYILDPKEVHGEDFPGETFRVLKEEGDHADTRYE